MFPQPWGFPAREFLRKKLIGKEICFTVEYKTGQGREYGMVYLGKGESGALWLEVSHCMRGEMCWISAELAWVWKAAWTWNLQHLQALVVLGFCSPDCTADCAVPW